MNINKHSANTEMELNMTSMIDVVFLLIIFFMIITDLTQQDLEELQLPQARSSVKDKPDPDVVRPILNIPISGSIVYKTKPLYMPEEGLDMTTLERFLAGQATSMPKKADPALGGMLLPDNPIMIRADRNTEFKYIQRIMAICGKDGIRIWKLELGAAEDAKEKAKREALEAGN